MWSQFTRWAFGGNPQPSRILSDELSGQFRQLNDSVYELYRPEGYPTMQILFFPGFSFDNSDAMLSTWLSEDGSCVWPGTWLTEDYPDAHILAVSYSSSMSHGALDPHIMSENIMLDVIQAGVGQVRDCPLVLVGHSLGGMVIKLLCNLVAQHQYYSSTSAAFRVVQHTNFVENLRGIFYYATPNHGSSMAKLFVKSSNPTPTMRCCEFLDREAARLNVEFQNLSAQYAWQVAGLGEGAPTNLGFFNDIIVPEFSARTMSSFYVVPGADHFSITRPRSKSSRSYYSLLNFLHNILDNSSSDLPRNIGNFDSQLHDILGKLDTNETFGLVGMGGSGKTTLAKAVFNKIAVKFDYTCFVSDAKFILHGGIVTATEHLWKHMHYRGRKVSKKERWSQLRGKSLLLVLDGIFGEKQLLPKLVKFSSPGSRLIIVTSRDTDLVRRLCADLYKVPLLDEENARQLFVSNAFSDPHTIPLKLGPLVDAFVKKCHGLPLALEVCGRYLRGKEIEEVWEQTLVALNGLGGSGLDEIWATLRESYDNLSYYEQQMFLDAATFLSMNRSWTLGEAKKVWKQAYDIDPRIVSRLWQTLVDQFLVDDVEEDENVKLHALLRSLGQRIADEPSNQGKRRNVTEWSMLLQQADDLYEQEVISLRPSAGLSEGLSAEGEDSSVLSALVLQVDKKQGLEVSIPITIDGGKGLEDLLDLGGLNTPKHLVITNFPGSSLPGEIFQLVDLQQLEIQNCSHVKELPESLGQLKNLGRLVILNCPSLSVVPETLGSLGALRHLEFQDCEGLIDLPRTLGRLCSLVQLILWNCPGLTEIPDTIGAFWNLRHLVIHGCEGLKGLSVGQLKSLEYLVVSNCPRLTEILLPIEELWALKHLRIQDCESLKILPETLKQLEDIEYVTISNCSNVSTFLKACGDELLEVRAPARHCQQMSTSMKSFIAALETEGRNNYLVSTEWLSNLQDHEKDKLASICKETGYRLAYQTTSNSYYERSHDHVENKGFSNDGGRPVDNATSSGVSKTRDDPIPKHRQRLQIIDDGVDVIHSSGELSSTQSGNNPDGEDDVGRRVGDKATWSGSQTGDDKHLRGFCTDDAVDMAGASGVSVATETSKEGMDVRTCAPKILQVKCCGPSEPTATSVLKHHDVKHFGACLVTLPRREDFEISTIVEETIRLPTHQWRASRLVKEHVSVRIFVETTISCCLRSDDNPKKVHVKISKVRGEMKDVNIADPRNHDTFLRSVRTNVWAGIIDDGVLQEPISLDLMERAQLALTGLCPEGSLPNSTTVEFRDHAKQIGRNQAILFVDRIFPATLEGTIVRPLSPTSVLEVEIRYQLGLESAEPADGGMPNDDERHCVITFKPHPADFGCIIEIKTRDLLLSSF